LRSIFVDSFETGIKQYLSGDTAAYPFETEEFARRLKIPVRVTVQFSTQRDAFPLQVRRAVDLHIVKLGMAPGSNGHLVGSNSDIFWSRCMLQGELWYVYHAWTKPGCVMLCFAMEMQASFPAKAS
jgi:hypothetical protein